MADASSRTDTSIVVDNDDKNHQVILFEVVIFPLHVKMPSN